MKRAALILLTAIYLLSCVGMGINRFYCCGKLAAVTITYAAADDDGAQSSNNNNCCKHEIKSFKVKDSHFKVLSLSFSQLLPSILPAFIHLDNETIRKILSAKITHSSNAPPVVTTPIYTRNCAYRI
ncbi:hypothetical protein [Mucilaginibacter sp. UR6-11]|uniref:HYC_CC_PP family protein n=1 Tax=Mucilaginibacter sp. UR6-11 TaxID=1435644 RepID=UPI001E30827D|nr:hypothetical protein [Mucilaginibacter sp. UR6-11]MCC8426590.1 hypothetical protein [Mucilaginibacter sp. UR6-11]